MAKTVTACPHCSARYRVNEEKLGKRARCKKCGKAFVMTEPKEGPESADSGRSVAPATEAEVRAAEDDVPRVWNVGDVILDLYEVTEVLGEGGFGTVYKVHHKGWDMDLAVKCPKPGKFETERQVENFERECETWVNLGLHPNTVNCYYVRRLGGMTPAYCSLEQAEGQGVTRKTDIWSWGVSVLEMFTGGVIWPSGSVVGDLLPEYLEMGEDGPFRVAMPDTLAELLGQCFRQQPDDRPKGMHEIAAGLKDIYQEATGEGYHREEPKAADHGLNASGRPWPCAPNRGEPSSISLSVQYKPTSPANLQPPCSPPALTNPLWTVILLETVGRGQGTG